MAAKKEELMNDGLTVVAQEKKPEYSGPMVDIFLPALEGGDDGGIKVDQYEHVTVANEEKESVYRVLRGEHVQVPVSVYWALKQKYPKL